MNEAADARKGEELDGERLRSYLASHLEAGANEITILQFPAGSSNLTYLISVDGREYVLRRPPFGNTVKSAHDMHREHKVLSKLSAVYPPAPKPILFCDDTSVIGDEFYLMERRNGLVIRGMAPKQLEDSQELQLRVAESFVKNLAELHALDYEAAGLGDLGKPEGYVRRQVEGWSKRYFAAKTDDWPALEKAIAWLNENVPDESGAALVHNDYKFDNVMLDPDDLTRVVAVLDWEMVTIGDPLMDLGTTLGYWMSREAGNEMLTMPFNPRVLMENISRQELADRYAAASGRDISNILFYYVFGTFKIAAIAQQIYARYVKGLTRDARFANFDGFVGALGKMAGHAIRAGRV
jgi:aminoglycoside phosphotransferase (APT) family kinase protein